MGKSGNFTYTCIYIVFTKNVTLFFFVNYKYGLSFSKPPTMSWIFIFILLVFPKKEYKCCTCLSLVSFFRASVPIVEIFFNSLLSVGLKLVSNSLRSCDAFWAASLLNLAYTNLASTYNLKILINHQFLYVI